MTKLKEKRKHYVHWKCSVKKNTVNVRNVCAWQNGIMSNIIYLWIWILSNSEQFEFRESTPISVMVKPNAKGGLQLIKNK